MRYNKIHARCTSHLSMKTNCLLVTRVIYTSTKYVILSSTLIICILRSPTNAVNFRPIKITLSNFERHVQRSRGQWTSFLFLHTNFILSKPNIISINSIIITITRRNVFSQHSLMLKTKRIQIRKTRIICNRPTLLQQRPQQYPKEEYPSIFPTPSIDGRGAIQRSRKRKGTIPLFLSLSLPLLSLLHLPIALYLSQFADVDISLHGLTTHMYASSQFTLAISQCNRLT